MIRKAPKRSLTTTMERMERHKILERKRREKTKDLMCELRNMIPGMEDDNDTLTMNKVSPFCTPFPPATPAPEWFSSSCSLPTRINRSLLLTLVAVAGP